MDATDLTQMMSSGPRERRDAGAPEHDDRLAADLGRQIRRLRQEKGWSQRWLARQAGVVQQNLSLYERGLTNPRLETLGRLAAALDAEVRIEPRREPASGEEPGEPFSLPLLMEYVDRQIERTLEREREKAGSGKRAG